jgi:hypothetical protein
MCYYKMVQIWYFVVYIRGSQNKLGQGAKTGVLIRETKWS